MIKKILLAATALILSVNFASAKDLKLIGISGASMGNPFFVALAEGCHVRGQEDQSCVGVTTVAYDYDLGRQFTEIDNFIAAGADMILLSAGDPKAIKTAIVKAEAAGITVVAVDARAEGADVTVTTDNVQRVPFLANTSSTRWAGRQRHHSQRAAGLRGRRPRARLHEGYVEVI